MFSQCHELPRSVQLTVFDLLCCRDTIYARVECGDSILPGPQVSPIDCRCVPAGLDDKVKPLSLHESSCVLPIFGVGAQVNKVLTS